MRSFMDGDGVQWQVWKTIPQSGFSMDRRLSDHCPELRNSSMPPRSDGERRRGDIRKGWLCFESSTERRRLFPIPEEWETCDTRTLETLCREALPGRAPRVPSPSVQATETPSPARA